MILALFALLFTAAPAKAAAKRESILKFDYRAECDPADQNSFPGIVAEIKVGQRRIRAYLLRYLREQSVMLGANSGEMAGMEIKYLPNPGCKLASVKTHVQAAATDSLALKHAPYLVLRPDQDSRPDRDIPFHLAYSKLPRPSGGFELRYTIYFSNETDNSVFSTTKSKSMALWGRRTDIEWIYAVEFNAKGKIVSRAYQGGVIMGIGHSTKPFHGKFLEGTDHPVLYNIARHNVFSDEPDTGQDLKMAAAHLTPGEEIAEPEAREDWMWNNPWSFDLSDRELRRTGELSYPSEDYLYVRLTGNIGSGKLAISGAGMTMERIILTRLGEDLWNKSDYTAFRIKEFPAEGRPVGKSVEFTASDDSVKIEKFQFLRLVRDVERGFRVQNVTQAFACVRGSCRY